MSNPMNPWEEIDLEIYEKHMRSENVFQLQTLNQMMRDQLAQYPVKSVMVLGIAGGNGLEHISPDRFEKVYGIDINAGYVVADLFVEYVGCGRFTEAVKAAAPRYVSVVIQIDEKETFVSASPYLHYLEKLDAVHHEIDAAELVQEMNGIGYELKTQCKEQLPNGKQFHRLDFAYLPSAQMEKEGKAWKK